MNVGLKIEERKNGGVEGLYVLIDEEPSSSLEGLVVGAGGKRRISFFFLSLCVCFALLCFAFTDENENKSQDSDD